MDATCFPVDWFSKTRGPSFSQYSGHWTHLVTCAHVICPWDYPNYYPPQGPTRFVSHITLADTMTQVRLTSLQGQAVYKHFVSNQHVYVHTNPRLDLCVLHAEQNLKRSGEMKMMWMQNEGYVIRPRLEINERVQEGDHVWIYGKSAHESLFDEEKLPEPLMIPTGIRAKVHAVTKEHFFLDTTSLEGHEKGQVSMGMCGSVIMRNGKCVGMLTATVHAESQCKELAGTAMCTHSQDIFEFLLEVEEQMKQPPPRQQHEETRFESKRREEGKSPEEFKDWDLDHSRTARHIRSPVSLYHMEESWMTEEDYMTSAVFGRSGPLNQETQESALGYDIHTSKSYGERPGDIASFSNSTPNGKPGVQGERKDNSPTGIYADHEDFKTKDVWESTLGTEMRDLFDRSADGKDAEQLQMMRKTLENIRARRALEKMKESALHQATTNGRSKSGVDGDGRPDQTLKKREDFSSMGHYGGNCSAGAANFDPSSEGFTASASPRESDLFSCPPFSSCTSSESSHDVEEQCSEHKTEQAKAKSKSEQKAETLTEKRKRERRESEAKYQDDLRRRHGHKVIPFTDPDLQELWKQH